MQYMLQAAIGYPITDGQAAWRVDADMRIPEFAAQDLRTGCMRPAGYISNPVPHLLLTPGQGGTWL